MQEKSLCRGFSFKDFDQFFLSIILKNTHVTRAIFQTNVRYYCWQRSMENILYTEVTINWFLKSIFGSSSPNSVTLDLVTAGYKHFRSDTFQQMRKIFYISFVHWMFFLAGSWFCNYTFIPTTFFCSLFHTFFYSAARSPITVAVMIGLIAPQRHRKHRF